MKREIFFCNLHIEYKNKIYIIKEVVYKESNGWYFNMRELNKLNIKEKVKVIKYDVIKSLGFENTSKDYTEVKKSNEIRNKITGSYD